MNTDKLSLNILFGIALLLVLCPFLFIQSQYYVTGNVAWLYIAAERFLDGSTMVNGFYETNPPLSILLYVPHVIISALTGVSAPWAIFTTTLLFIALSTLCVGYIIAYFDWLNPLQMRIFLIAYIISITINTTIFYAEREHFIIMLILPFLLYQYSLTQRIEFPVKFSAIIITFGVLGVLIKPHYGLLPTLMICHRIATQFKTTNFLKQHDFNALAIGTILYVSCIFIFFDDYLNVIFPDVLSLYAARHGDLAHVFLSSQIHLVAYIIFFMLECFSSDLKKKRKSFILFLYMAALVNLIPYYVQLKGFYNHLIPAYVFFTLAISMSVTCRLSLYLSNYKKSSFTLSCLLLLCLSWLLSPLSLSFPKKSDIRALPVAQFLEQKCPKPCTFFAFHGDIEIFYPTALEMGYTHGTRFPAYWFLPKIIRSIYEGDDQKPVSFYKSLKEKYSNLSAEDLNTLKPSILLVAKDIQIGNVYGFDLVNSFSEFENFRSAMKQYKQTDEIFKFERSAYFAGTNIADKPPLEYEIYIRKNINP